MEIKLDSLVIEDDKFEAVATIKGILSTSNGFSDRYRFAENVEKMIVDRITTQYLLENTDKIISNINLQNVINAVTLRIAKNLGDRHG